MQITVNIEDFVDKMKDDMEEYTKEYQKLVELYQTKHREYNEYLKNQIKTFTSGEDMEKLKSPPYMPWWDGKKYTEIITALGAHTANTITMSTAEYNEAREAIHQATLNIGTAFAGMMSDSY